MTDNRQEKPETLATSNVRDLVRDVLDARFSPPPYPEDIIDQVCLAIESNKEWLERYQGLVKELSRSEGDGWWKVNNWIGRWTREQTGMIVAAASVPSKNKLMKSYSRLKYPTGEEAAIFVQAVKTLRGGLSALEKSPDLIAIQRGRDEVYDRYGRGSFAPANLPILTAEEFKSFLLFDNNHHWTSINRYGSRTTADMDALRTALTVLLDETRPVPERYDQATGGMVKGIGRAIATPILHVVYPERYAVWNTKVEDGLRDLSLHPPQQQKATEGEQYAAVNELLLRLAAALEIDLWTLDSLWEWMTQRRKLASPFDKIFADRGQAEWAFDLIADAVTRLGGRPDDQRFALTLPHANMLRLNIGNSMVMDIANLGHEFHLTGLIDKMESVYSFDRGESFHVTVKGTKQQFAVYTIPPDVVRQWPENLQAIFEQTMTEFGAEFAHWQKSNLRWAHNESIFEALFDGEKRDHLLTGGLAPLRYWRITLPSDMPEDMSDGRGSYDFWADCLEHGVAAIGFDNQPGDPQIAKFASIRPGDRVVAFLRNKTIGGIGVVTSPLDEKTEEERPAEQNFFHGKMWRRIGVDWTPSSIRVDDLPKRIQNKFGQSTVVELTADEFAAVEKLMKGIIPPPPPDSPIAREFKGFTHDTFVFMKDLAANNNKAWMEANRDRWREGVLEPMRALFTDLGPHVKRLFDPYLLPDELEIEPTAHKVLARINKNWSATPDSKYHEYYWGAFYRKGLTRQTDAQLFVTIAADFIRFGLNFGDDFDPALSRLRERTKSNPALFEGMVTELISSTNLRLYRVKRNSLQILDEFQPGSDLVNWALESSFEIMAVISQVETVSSGHRLADTIFDTFRRIFPLYLLAVADEPEAIIERYLANEFPSDDDDIEIEPPPTPYTRDEFLDHTNLLPDQADELLDALEEKRQAIFFGPPGTGKTYVAKHLSGLLTGLADPPPERVEIVQFHPAYSYEEFIEGIRPKRVEGGTAIDYPVERGAFARFCRIAAQNPNQPHVFIIDEINRGNIPRIFGELMLLLEYRNESVLLPYSGERFRIPKNVYLIGTMNTADRSIALVDFALRRRFHFFEFAADPDLFDRWLAKQNQPLPYLSVLYRRLTNEAIDDKSFRIGPSYFMVSNMDTRALARVWRRSVIPYLKEYYFDQPGRAELWAWDGDLLREIRGGDGK